MICICVSWTIHIIFVIIYCHEVNTIPCFTVVRLSCQRGQLLHSILFTLLTSYIIFSQMVTLILSYVFVLFKLGLTLEKDHREGGSTCSCPTHWPPPASSANWGFDVWLSSTLTTACRLLDIEGSTCSCPPHWPWPAASGHWGVDV